MAENYKILAQNVALGSAAQNRYLALVDQYSSPVVAYSTNLAEWSISSLPVSANWDNTLFVEGSFYAIGIRGSGQGAASIYSTDGVSWTQGNVPSSSIGQGLAYGSGKFVTTGYFNTSFAYSTDFITWTTGTMPSVTGSPNWPTIIYGEDKFVAIKESQTTYSTDGITWNSNASLPSSMLDIVYGQNNFVAVGSTNAVYSTDGISWSSSTIPASVSSITYGNERFVAIGSGTSAAYSTDGTTWVLSSIPDQLWEEISFGDGKFFAVSQPNSNLGYAVIAYSTDGITWTQQALPAGSSVYDYYYRNVSYGNPTLPTAQTQYTVPSSNQAAISSISIISNDTVSHTYSVGIVKAADTEILGISNTQTIIPTRTIAPGVVDEVVGGITLSAGDQIRTNSDSTDLTVHIYGVELS
jgi:hypothetical protein